MENKKYTFNISLSVLNHLGRNLYRNFVTILGEGISNAWDADADSVYIYYNPENKTLCIIDNGAGMSSEDFQGKFLLVGYTKRRDSGLTSPSGRHFIGRKGIGKLALLSAAETVTVVTKTNDSELVGGVIDNSGLDAAIDEDTQQAHYPLGTIDPVAFLEEKNIKMDKSGTVVWFDGLKEKTNHAFDFIKKSLALYFRFSLQDPNFKIYFNDELITVKELQGLCDKTQFLWQLNDAFSDDFINQMSPKKTDVILDDQKITGFIASVNAPRDRNIFGSGERVGIDVFVNGRIREVDILKHFPRSRIPEQYLYGQVHLNDFDSDEVDRFTSSREGIHVDDPDFKVIREKLGEVVNSIIKQWDVWRLELREEGDNDNEENLKKEQRYSRNLYNQVASKYIPASEQADTVRQWEHELEKDAELNLRSYAECFISENLLRRHISNSGTTPTNCPRMAATGKKCEGWDPEKLCKFCKAENRKAGLEQQRVDAKTAIQIRENENDVLLYLDYLDLAELIDDAVLSDKDNPYRPLRNSVMHTAMLTDEAKTKLTDVFNDVVATVKKLISKTEEKA
jgi:hypothetical protein